MACLGRQGRYARAYVEEALRGGIAVTILVCQASEVLRFEKDAASEPQHTRMQPRSFSLSAPLESCLLLAIDPDVVRPFHTIELSNKSFARLILSSQGDLELSIREAKEAALPTLPARDWLGQVREAKIGRGRE